MSWITGCSKLMQKTSHCYCPCYCSFYFTLPRFAASASLKALSCVFFLSATAAVFELGSGSAKSVCSVFITCYFVCCLLQQFNLDWFMNKLHLPLQDTKQAGYMLLQTSALLVITHSEIKTCRLSIILTLQPVVFYVAAFSTFYVTDHKP